MKKLYQEFKKFISRGNVIELAVGLVVGSAFTAIVNSLVNSIIMPLISLITGGTNLSSLKWVVVPEVVNASGEVVTKEVAFGFGSFIQAVIDFLLIAIVVFFIIKAFNAAKDLADAKAKKIRDEIEKKQNKEKKDEEEKASEGKVEEVKVAETVDENTALLKEIRDLLKEQNKKEEK